MIVKLTRDLTVGVFAALLGGGSTIAQEADSPSAEALASITVLAGNSETEAEKGKSGFVTDTMKLVFEDNFNGTSLDLTKWFPGPKPDGGQWGGAHFVAAQEVGFTSVYIVKDGMLTLRAHHDPTYEDPEKWKRTWYGGQISTAFPRKPSPSAIRTGYIETRAKFPKNKGSWPGFWMLSSDTEPTAATNPGGVEVDALEFYGDAPSKFSSGTVYWPGNTGRPRDQGKLVWTDTGADLTRDFHVYGVQITDTEVIIYFDRQEVQRFSLPRPKTTGKFFVLLDNAIHTDNGVDVPSSGYADAIFDYVRVWEDQRPAP